MSRKEELSDDDLIHKLKCISLNNTPKLIPRQNIYPSFNRMESHGFRLEDLIPNKQSRYEASIRSKNFPSFDIPLPCFPALKGFQQRNYSLSRSKSQSVNSIDLNPPASQPKCENKDGVVSEPGYVLRALFTIKEAGVIIGKNGINLNTLRFDSSTKTIISKPKTEINDRVLSISGTVDNVAKAVSLISFNLATNSLTNTYTVQGQIGVRMLTKEHTFVRILVPHALMGAILGKQGKNVQLIEKKMCVRIIATKLLLPNSTERLVEIHGSHNDIFEAMKEVGRCLCSEWERGIGTIFYVPNAVLAKSVLEDWFPKREPLYPYPGIELKTDTDPSAKASHMYNYSPFSLNNCLKITTPFSKANSSSSSPIGDAAQLASSDFKPSSVFIPIETKSLIIPNNIKNRVLENASNTLKEIYPELEPIVAISESVYNDYHTLLNISGDKLSANRTFYILKYQMELLESDMCSSSSLSLVSSRDSNF